MHGGLVHNFIAVGVAEYMERRDETRELGDRSERKEEERAREMLKG
jgi:hypothetical protein